MNNTDLLNYIKFFQEIKITEEEVTTSDEAKNNQKVVIAQYTYKGQTFRTNKLYYKNILNQHSVRHNNRIVKYFGEPVYWLDIDIHGWPKGKNEAELETTIIDEIVPNGNNEFKQLLLKLANNSKTGVIQKMMGDGKSQQYHHNFENNNHWHDIIKLIQAIIENKGEKVDRKFFAPLVFKWDGKGAEGRERSSLAKEVENTSRSFIDRFYKKVKSVQGLIPNQSPIQKIIKRYKDEFETINLLEIYKWKAVKCFQDNWDLDAADFPEMVEKSLAETKNLMDAGNYLPRQAIVSNAKKSPKEVKELFQKLLNENEDLIERIDEFRVKISAINKGNFDELNAFQDHRAAMVYLFLKYPNRYYPYKYGMFKDFLEFVDYPYKVVKGRTENVTHFLNLCEQIKPHVEQDEELLRLHTQRVLKEPKAYAGNSVNLLVQDIIYAATFHFKDFPVQPSKKALVIQVEVVNAEVISSKPKTTFKGAFINYQEKQKSNKNLGDLGESFVLKHENEKLKNQKKQAEQVSITQGDGLGYDIKSYDDEGEEIYIEVKTTSGGFGTKFYVTKTELSRSIIEGDKYRLYRVYNFDSNNRIGKIAIIEGSLEKYCCSPESYGVKLKIN